MTSKVGLHEEVGSCDMSITFRLHYGHLARPLDKQVTTQSLSDVKRTTPRFTRCHSELKLFLHDVAKYGLFELKWTLQGVVPQTNPLGIGRIKRIPITMWSRITCTFIV